MQQITKISQCKKKKKECLTNLCISSSQEVLQRLEVWVNLWMQGTKLKMNIKCPWCDSAMISVNGLERTVHRCIHKRQLCKEATRIPSRPKRPPSPLGLSSLNLDGLGRYTSLRSDESKALFENHKHWILRDKKNEVWVCYQCTVQKAAWWW